MQADLRLGRWQDVLADVECDALITDPPFGERTHGAWRDGERASGPGYKAGIAAKLKRKAIDYDHWTPEDVAAFVAHWSPRTRGWMVALTSHELAPAWQAAYEAAGRYCFAPLPCVTWGGSIRLQGDGPSSWTVWAMVARPRARKFQAWVTMPGAYVVQRPANDGAIWGGGRGKSIDLMKALLRDYSRPGDLICDPCAGHATTGVAALTMGRRFVGSECDEATFHRARKRLAETQVVDLFDAGRAVQPGLFEGER